MDFRKQLEMIEQEAVMLRNNKTDGEEKSFQVDDLMPSALQFVDDAGNAIQEASSAVFQGEAIFVEDHLEASPSKSTDNVLQF